MSATSIPVARLLQLGVPIAWQEAVELARSAHQLAESSGVPLLLDQCVISTEGTVHFVPPATSRPGPALTVLDLLAILIQGQDAPAELRALVDGDGDQRFDLTWFSSPRPDLEIARLATRGIEAAAAHDAQAAIHRLRSDVTDTPPSSKAPTAPSRFSPRVLLRPLVTAAAVVLLLAAAALVVRTAMAPTPAPAVVGDAAPAASTSFIDTAFDSLKRALAPSEDAAPAPAAAASATDSAAAGTARVGRAPLSTPANATTPATLRGPAAGPASAVPSATGGVGEVSASADQVDVRTTMPRVYSREDRDVEPPAFIYPQMPSEPREDSPLSDSHIEVVVDEQGRVVQVRLRSTDATLNDRMIVAAAKAWQFRPALKDGQPVPYVLQVPVTR